MLAFGMWTGLCLMRMGCAAEVDASHQKLNRRCHTVGRGLDEQVCPNRQLRCSVAVQQSVIRMRSVFILCAVHCLLMIIV